MPMILPASLAGPLGLVLLAVLPTAFGCTHPACHGLEILVLLLLAFWIGWHRTQVRKLQRWFASADNILPPEASGQWEELFSIAYRWRKGEEQQARVLRQTLQQLQEAMDALPDALLLIDARGQMVWGNRGTAPLLGLHWPEDRGQSLSFLVRQPRFRHFVEQGVAGQLQIPSPVSPERTLEASRYLLPGGGSVMLFRDISRLLQLERMRQEFVANVSHELRSPLTVLGGFIETLQDTPVCEDEEVTGYLGLMAQQTSRMQALVADLLTLARLEADTTVRQDEPVRLAQLVGQLLRALQEELETKRLQVETVLDEDLCLLAQNVDLTSIVRNLIENAVYYTPAGERISIAWTRTTDGAAFAVEDTGHGIAPEHLPRLTERFYRVDKGRARRNGGTGLGLSIVKHAVARYDGRLLIESEPGKGSCFRVWFPAARLCACP